LHGDWRKQGSDGGCAWDIRKSGFLRPAGARLMPFPWLFMTSRSGATKPRTKCAESGLGTYKMKVAIHKQGSTLPSKTNS